VLIINRLAAILLALLMVLAGMFTLAVAAGYLPPEALRPLPVLQAVAAVILVQSSAVLIWSTLGALAAVLAGIALLVLELRAPRQGGLLCIRQDALGTVAVSLLGLRRLVEQVAGELPGVDGAAAEVLNTRQGLVIRCRLAVKPEVSVPDITTEARERLTEAVAHHVGQAPARIHLATQAAPLALGKRRIH
jgi:hypothetical protein